MHVIETSAAVCDSVLAWFFTEHLEAFCTHQSGTKLVWYAPFNKAALESNLLNSGLNEIWCIFLAQTMKWATGCLTEVSQ